MTSKPTMVHSEAQRDHMASDKKISANRLNAQKSTGPRTRRGKSRASRNAWRHGWAVAKTGHSGDSARVECIAKTICGGRAAPALYEQAVIIAECEVLLLQLRAARAATKLAQAKPEATSTGHMAIEQLSPRPMTIPDAAAQRRSRDKPIPRRQDDMGALQRRLSELVRLDRYERRAFSRRNRAIRMFEAISIVTGFLRCGGGGMVMRKEQARVHQRRSSRVRGDGFS
jgi:hypothetical protein